MLPRQILLRFPNICTYWPLYISYNRYPIKRCIGPWTIFSNMRFKLVSIVFYTKKWCWIQKCYSRWLKLWQNGSFGAFCVFFVRFERNLGKCYHIFLFTCNIKQFPQNSAVNIILWMYNFFHILEWNNRVFWGEMCIFLLILGEKWKYIPRNPHLTEMLQFLLEIFHKWPERFFTYGMFTHILYRMLLT